MSIRAKSILRGAMAGIVAGALLAIIDNIWAFLRVSEHGYTLHQQVSFYFYATFVLVAVGVWVGSIIGLVSHLLSRLRLPSWLSWERIEALMLSTTTAVLILALRNYYWLHWYEFGPFSIETPHLRRIALISLSVLVFLGCFVVLKRFKAESVGRDIAWVMIGLGVIFVAGRAAYEASRLGPMNYIHAVSVLGSLGYVSIGLFRRMSGPQVPQLLKHPIVLICLIGGTIASMPLIGGLAKHDTRLFLYERTAFTYRVLWMNPAFHFASRLQAPTPDECASADIEHAYSRPDESTGRADYVVVIVIDTLRRDRLGAERGNVQLTREIKKFADKSYNFTRAYVSQPGTRVAFGSFLTGRAPGPPDYRIGDATDATIAPLLNEEEVYTAAVPSEKALYEYTDHFDVVDDAPYRESFDEHTSSLVTDRAIQLAEEMAKKERGFLLVHYLDPHAPHRIPEDFDFGRRLEEKYDAEVAHTDRAVGRLLDELDDRIPDNRATFILSDHGEEFWDHGYRFHASRLYEESVQILALMNLPGQQDSTQVSSLVSAEDLAPTVLDLFGIAESERTSGLSWVREPKGERELFLYSRDLERVGFVNEKYKFIMNRRPKIFELYDLRKDPEEQNNIADKERVALESKLCRLYEWQMKRQISGSEDIRTEK